MHDELDNEYQHTFDVEDRRVRMNRFSTLKTIDTTIEEAAELMNLDVSEIEWALEEFGRCDAEDWVVWQPNETNGIEFPTAEAPAET